MPADAEFLKQLSKNLASAGALEEHERLELEDIARFLARCDSAKAELVLRLTALREALTQLLRDLGADGADDGERSSIGPVARAPTPEEWNDY